MVNSSQDSNSVLLNSKAQVFHPEKDCLLHYVTYRAHMLPSQSHGPNRGGENIPVCFWTLTLGPAQRQDQDTGGWLGSSYISLVILLVGMGQPREVAS